MLLLKDAQMLLRNSAAELVAKYLLEQCSGLIVYIWYADGFINYITSLSPPGHFGLFSLSEIIPYGSNPAPNIHKSHYK